jgi:short subunit dehydrogenase-like uncharacterized protein
MRIAVHGASGFTGRLAVAEVRRRGFVPVLVGRDGERLRKAAVEAGAPEAEVRVARLEEGALADAFLGCEVVVNCAGPFTVLGEPVVRAAIAAGVHYLDTAGEQHYIREVLDAFRAEAVRAGVAVVPAMADDGGPGDMIARLVAERASSAVGSAPEAPEVAEVAEVLVADLRGPGVASRGTARSMAAVSEQGALAYTDGVWHPAAGDAPAVIALPREVAAAVAPPRGAAGRGEVADGHREVAGPGEAVVEEFALPGVVTVPRHVKARRVRSVIRAEVAGLFAAPAPDVVEQVPEVPDEAVRTAARWLMLAEATGTDGRRARGWVTGFDAYGMTAVIAVEGARRLVVDGAPAGTLTPAQAFDPASFLDHLTAHGVTWHVTAI